MQRNSNGLASLVAVPVFSRVLSKVNEDPLVIVPVETWETDRKNAIIAVGIAALFGVGFGMVLGRARGIAFGVALALAMASRFGKREVRIPIRVRPNQAIEFSKRR